MYLAEENKQADSPSSPVLLWLQRKTIHCRPEALGVEVQHAQIRQNMSRGNITSDHLIT